MTETSRSSRPARGRLSDPTRAAAARVVQRRTSCASGACSERVTWRYAGGRRATTVVGDHQGPGDADAIGAFLLVVGRDSYTTYNLPAAGTLTIGRGESNAVRIDDPLASRAHARLHVGETMFLEDLGSVNGTRIK